MPKTKSNPTNPPPPQSILDYVAHVLNEDGLEFLLAMSKYYAGGMDVATYKEIEDAFGDKVDEFISEIPEEDLAYLKREDAIITIMMYTEVKTRKSPKPTEEQKAATKAKNETKRLEKLEKRKDLDLVQVCELEINEVIAKKVKKLTRAGYSVTAPASYKLEAIFVGKNKKKATKKKSATSPKEPIVAKKVVLKMKNTNQNAKSNVPVKNPLLWDDEPVVKEIPKEESHTMEAEPSNQFSNAIPASFSQAPNEAIQESIIPACSLTENKEFDEEAPSGYEEKNSSKEEEEISNEKMSDSKEEVSNDHAEIPNCKEKNNSKEELSSDHVEISNSNKEEEYVLGASIPNSSVSNTDINLVKKEIASIEKRLNKYYPEMAQNIRNMVKSHNFASPMKELVLVKNYIMYRAYATCDKLINSGDLDEKDLEKSINQDLYSTEIYLQELIKGNVDKVEDLKKKNPILFGIVSSEFEELVDNVDKTLKKYKN